MGGPRRSENPVTGLKVLDEPAITPAPRHVTEKVVALTTADGVTAVALVATVPVDLARVP